MSRKYLCWAVAVILSAVAWFYSGLGTAGAEPEAVAKVTADDLASGKVVVVGRLGIPLKTMMTIRGVWKYPPRGKHPTKTFELSFHVTHVNDHALDEPITFYRAVVHVTYPLPREGGDKKNAEPTPSEGDVWEIRAYETGGFRWRPAEFAKELGAPPDESSAWAEWESPFLVELHGIMQRPGAASKTSERGKGRDGKTPKR
jgi:hypothetical protein